MYSKFIIIFSLVLSFTSLSQKLTSSPYSSYGLGEYGTLENANYIALGNATSGIADSLSLNFFNPASYSFLGQGQPIFSTGLSSRFSENTENSTTNKSQLIGINHFAFGVPFGKLFGMAFGVKPFSKVGYSFTNYEVLGSDSIRYRYTGSGSINDAFLGFSTKILNVKKHKIALGTNFSYLFGNTVNEQTSNLTSQTNGGVNLLKYQVKSLYYNFGLVYNFEITHNQSINLGVTYHSKQDINSFKTNDIYYSTEVENLNKITDTIKRFYENKNISLPSMIDFGFDYKFRPKQDSNFNKTKVYQIGLFGSFQKQNWSEYKTNFSDEIENTLMNTTRISFGIEYAPHYNFLDRTKSIGYLSRMRYRAGIFTSTLPYSTNGIQHKNSALTLGLSLPIISQRSISSINFGFSFGQKGINNAQILNERYLGINVGVSITPGNYDKWFKKYKID